VQTTDAQVRKLMEEMRKHGEVGRAGVTELHIAGGASEAY
jgi:hypothetical protein